MTPMKGHEGDLHQDVLELITLTNVPCLGLGILTVTPSPPPPQQWRMSCSSDVSDVLMCFGGGGVKRRTRYASSLACRLPFSAIQHELRSACSGKLELIVRTSVETALSEIA